MTFLLMGAKQEVVEEEDPDDDVDEDKVEEEETRFADRGFHCGCRDCGVVDRFHCLPL
jgi:hypothetical protein